MNFNKSIFIVHVVCCALLLTMNSYAQKSAGYSANKQVIAKGDALFQRNCSECHNFFQGSIGPSLAGVTIEVSRDYLSKFIINPQLVIKSGNKRATDLLAKYKTQMPPHPQFKPADINALLAFLNTHTYVPVPVNIADLGPPITDPIPAKIPKAGLTLKLEEFATAPPTATREPITRINQTYVLKGGKADRFFILDMRGKLYEIKDKKFNVVMDMAKEKPNLVHLSGQGSGWGSFAFHPDFYKNGLIYTNHSERPRSAPADFGYSDSIRVDIQWVISEWKIKDPTAAVFTGECRELMRINNPTTMHSVQQVIFNPLAKPGDTDYGLLYIGVGDGGAGETNLHKLCNTNTQIRSSILRIDPAGRNSKNGKYGIPPTNPYASSKDPNILKEVYARGFRNPNRITWLPDGRMITSEIGFNNIEEINLVKPGADYGWPDREGTFLMNFKGKTNNIYPLPANDDPKYTYPVVQYDHDEGHSISGGYVYKGNIALLKGKYIFGDIYMGRVFYVEPNDLKLGKLAPIKEFDLQLNGIKAIFQDRFKNIKPDLRLGIGEDNNLYIFTKTDGRIWKVVDCVAN